MATAQKATKVPLIKGYLPLRIRIPRCKNHGIPESPDCSFLFVKEHQTALAETKSTSASPTAATPTLFVTNVLVIPGIRAELLLQSIFGRFGEVTRVTVVPNPRRQRQHDQQEDLAGDALTNWSTSSSINCCGSFLPLQCCASSQVSAKFAHVVFETQKDLKQCLKALSRIMSDDEKEEDGEGDTLPAVELDPIELQTLADESDRQWNEERKAAGGCDGYEVEQLEAVEPKSGLEAIVERCQSSVNSQSRAKLMEECNRVMQNWEDAEREAQQAKLAASQQPDEDGFVTVSYGGNSGQVGEALVRSGGGGTVGNSLKRRAKKSTRNRNSKKKTKKLVLDDFYRFQTKENRKKTLHALRERFEEDLKKVKQLKEDKQYRPF